MYAAASMRDLSFGIQMSVTDVGADPAFVYKITLNAKVIILFSLG